MINCFHVLIFFYFLFLFLDRAVDYADLTARFRELVDIASSSLSSSSSELLVYTALQRDIESRTTGLGYVCCDNSFEVLSATTV